MLKNKKGVSPVIAVVLMIAVAVAIAVIVYAWASGFAGKATGAGTNVWSFVIETKEIDDATPATP
ncbi:MAG: archaellin/type IV pilin N-terminal domain-containing protein, partial [Candidatus Methanofastidiosia archaeon]